MKMIKIIFIWFWFCVESIYQGPWGLNTHDSYTTNRCNETPLNDTNQHYPSFSHCLPVWIDILRDGVDVFQLRWCHWLSHSRQRLWLAGISAGGHSRQRLWLAGKSAGGPQERRLLEGCGNSWQFDNQRFSNNLKLGSNLLVESLNSIQTWSVAKCFEKILFYKSNQLKMIAFESSQGCLIPTHNYYPMLKQ